MQGAQILRNEAYFLVRRSDEGCSATPQMGSFHARHVQLLRVMRMGVYVQKGSSSSQSPVTA